MNRQEIFNKVYLGLKSQDKRSRIPRLDKGFVCQYRYENLRCAVGHLIPDSLYHERFEGRSVNYLKEVLDYLDVTSQEDLLFLESLQEIHDDIGGKWTSKFPNQGWMRDALLEFAAQEGLTVPDDKDDGDDGDDDEIRTGGLMTPGHPV